MKNSTVGFILLAGVFVLAVLYGFSNEWRFEWKNNAQTHGESSRPPYNLADGVYPTYIISMESSWRREMLRGLIANSSLPIKFFNAVDGRNVTWTGRNATAQYAVLEGGAVHVLYDLVQTVRNHRRTLANTEIGISLSHYSLYRKCHLEKLSAMLILEDDVQFTLPDDQVRRVLRLLPDPTTYDVAYLQKATRYTMREVVPGTNDTFHYTNASSGAYGYVVTQRMCRRAFETFVLAHAADGYLDWSHFPVVLVAAPRWRFVDLSQAHRSSLRLGHFNKPVNLTSS